MTALRLLISSEQVWREIASFHLHLRPQHATAATIILLYFMPLNYHLLVPYSINETRPSLQLCLRYLGQLVLVFTVSYLDADCLGFLIGGVGMTEAVGVPLYRDDPLRTVLFNGGVTQGTGFVILLSSCLHHAATALVTLSECPSYPLDPASSHLCLLFGSTPLLSFCLF